MVKAKKIKGKGGAPAKVAGGLGKVLFVRVNQELLDAIDHLVNQEREARPGRAVSRADVARDILSRFIQTSQPQEGA